MTRFATPVLAVLCLGACTSVPTTHSLSGIAATNTRMAGANITVRDSRAAVATTTADTGGRYRLDVSGLTPPLIVLASQAGAASCRTNQTPRATCVTAVVQSLTLGANTADVNPLTDQITSDVATALRLTGPQQLAETAAVPAIPAQVHADALRHLRAGFGPALAHAGGLDTGTFDPLTASTGPNGRSMDAVLAVINHTRGYDNDSGEASATVITDMGWRPISRPYGPDANEPLQLVRAQRELAAIQAARVRIFIVGDSTAATYERQRLPRMGWGQVFEEQFSPGSGVKVVNGARAGRSSRDFFNGGWYRQMARFIRPGDYVIIAHGHNDQNCNRQRPVRGAADVANLCTYPNDAHGQRQYPPGQPQMSFQNSLEVYVNDARARGAIPLLMTPTTRYLNADRKTAYVNGDTRPVVSQHLTRQNAANGFAFTGDYSQTIQDTARANGVPLIDLEAKTITFANTHAKDWQDYWLVVGDTVKYPWYATQTAGIPAAPDTTHFQEAGARAVAALVAQGIRETPALRPLAQHLK
ncbi:MAG: SGNH/GDSL hydrolase family protein [Pseudomonadota bacterium]